MADFHSSDGGRTSQHIPARQTLNRQEKMIFTDEGRDRVWTGISNEKQLSLGKGERQHRHRGSTNSDRSSNTTRNSSLTSKTGYRTSLEVLPFPPVPLLAKGENILSKMSVETSLVPPEMKTGKVHEPERETLRVSQSPVELQQPPSPRIRIGMFRAENPSYPRMTYLGPLERFLTQDNNPTGFESDPQKLEEEWGRLQGLRASTLRLRTQLRQMRKELHEKELAKSFADESFIKHVRENRAASILKSGGNSANLDDPILDDHYAAIQDARDEYGPLQDDYNNLEDLLDQQEFEMAKIEGRLYQTEIHETLGSELILQGLSSESPYKLHPLHISYLSRLGDFDLARERHQNMLQERDTLLYNQESRIHVGMKLHENERDFLDQFDAREAALVGEIAEIEQDVEQLRQKCLEEGIELSESSLGDIADTDNEVASPENASNQVSIEPSMFPLLLPRSDEDKVKLGVYITDFDEANKSDRINRWMRYQLQTSPLEVELLVRIFLHILKIVDLRQWQKGGFQWQVYVLDLWEHDEANRSLEVFKTPQTHSSITQSLISTLNGNCEISEKTATLLKPSKLVRRIRSAPCSIDLGKVCKKGELSQVKALLSSF